MKIYIFLLLVFSYQPSISADTYFTQEDARFCKNSTSPISQRVNARSLSDNGSVWRVGTNRWNLEYEKKFSKWIAEEVDENFMVKFDIRTDCADAPIVLRSIFARIHHLPQSFTNGGNNIIGNHTKDYKRFSTIPVWNESNWKQNLMKDKRFRYFLAKAAALVTTKTLHLNTYPIQIFESENPDVLSPYVKEGTIALSKHHTRFISKFVDSYYSVRQLSSTSGFKVRTLSNYQLFLSSYEKGGGIINWRWSYQCNGEFKPVSASSMPGYSTWQYEDENKENIIDRIRVAAGGDQKFTEETMEYQLELIKGFIRDRNESVNNALLEYIEGDEHSYDVFSTPSLDKKIMDSITEIVGLGEKFLKWDIDKTKEILSKEVVTLSGGIQTNLYWIYYQSGLNSEPGESYFTRWQIDRLLNYKHRTCNIGPKRELKNRMLEDMKKNDVIGKWCFWCEKIVPKDMTVPDVCEYIYPITL